MRFSEVRRRKQIQPLALEKSRMQSLEISPLAPVIDDTRHGSRFNSHQLITLINFIISHGEHLIALVRQTVDAECNKG